MDHPPNPWHFRCPKCDHSVWKNQDNGFQDRLTALRFHPHTGAVDYRCRDCGFEGTSFHFELRGLVADYPFRRERTIWMEKHDDEIEVVAREWNRVYGGGSARASGSRTSLSPGDASKPREVEVVGAWTQRQAAPGDLPEKPDTKPVKPSNHSLF